MTSTGHQRLDPVRQARQHGLGDLLRRTALRMPHKTAVVVPPELSGPAASTRRATFAEFNSEVNRLAGALAERGLRPGERAAVLSHNCWEFALLNFALAKLGAVMVPVNFMLGPDEIAYILDHSGAVAMAAEDALTPVADKAWETVGRSPRLLGCIPAQGGEPSAGWEPLSNWTAHADDSEPDVAAGDDDPLRLMYTSGTESRPKGVMLTSRSLVAQYVSCIVDGGMSGDDIEVHSLPMYHCAQLDCFFGPDVYLGATSVILPAPDPAALLSAIQDEQATKLFAPPTVWIALLRSPRFEDTDLSSLRKGYYGASAMPVEVLAEIQRRLPDVRLWNFYGQTEMAPLATILPPEYQVSHAGSAGRAALNVETRVVDDNDDPAPAGTVGEIVHRSPHACLGYWNDQAKTAEAFRNGWFHSGDLGVLTEDGYLSVVDRKKDMIKSGGENVASREVEEVIYRLDTVAEVAVFGVAHPVWIEAVVAAVVPKPGANLTSEDVIAHCRAHLAGFKTPKYVVLTDTLPKNPSGKLLKRDLRAAHGDLATPATPATSATSAKQDV
jgi:fatty-acyl-CoA synthase